MIARMLEISVDPAVAPVLALGVLVLGELVPRPPSELDQDVASLEADVRARHASQEAKEAFRAEARRLYKAFGIDPTKHRPSSEQLLLRILKGDPFPRVNPLVDAVNLCQIRFGLPYGLYDLAAVEPPVVARAGRPGEGYAGIRKGTISVEGRPCLVDAKGPFGNPSSDSDRTKTGESTRSALVVVFGSPATPGAEWARVLDGTSAVFERHAAGRVLEEKVVRG